jgi:hypothetical protein
VEWESAALRPLWDRPVHLEHERALVLPGLAADGASHVALSFVARDPSDVPTLELREGGADQPWRAAAPVVALRGGPLAVRVRAARNAVPRGAPFEATVRDTWVRSAPPEEQEVTWTFVSPTGEVHRTPAAYEGDSRWSVRFEPDELGRWRGFFEHRLATPYRSSDAVFDVVPGDCANVARQLRELPERIRTRYPDIAEQGHGKAPLFYFGPEFWHLERAAALCGTSGEPAARAAELAEAIREVRRTLMPWDQPPGTSAEAQ